MKFHVAARSQSAADKFRQVNPALIDAEFHVGSESLFNLLNEIIAGPHSFAMFLHDDAFYPSDFPERVNKAISDLNHEWPNWGICGNAGIGSIGYGLDTTQYVRFLFDPHGGPTQIGDVRPVESIDGNTMLINCDALKRNGVTLPTFFGYQLYDLCLSIETLFAGLAVLTSPLLACYHSSSGNQSDFTKAAASKGFLEFVGGRLSNRKFLTMNGVLKIPFSGLSSKNLIDIELSALRNASKSRPPRRLAIIVRSQFREKVLLLRTLQSIKSFAASAGDHIEITPVIITDRGDRIPDFACSYAEVIAVSPFEKSDSRSLILRAALQKITADFYCFVDDDDWLFPNEAERLACIISTASSGNIIFCDTMHFHETMSTTDTFGSRSYNTVVGSRFKASNWGKSLGGFNHIPFCGVILPRDVLKAMPSSVFERVTYYEDYAIQLFSILQARPMPIIYDKLFAGISVRTTSTNSRWQNSITEVDRSKWHMSNAELASIICNSDLGNLPFSFSPVVNRLTVANVPAFSRIERYGLVSARFLIGGYCYIKSPTRWGAGAKHFLSNFKEGGFRRLVMSVCTFR
ncbi:glycosyltransferase family 2 protein [Methylobacterium sp. 10]|uniref:glycosyltransferase family 2 protein n=1 Tax=Methylobacterium sp. 10 TaxID=1101191 RepID=UPI0004BA9A67|nr:glycosyltransferase family 2 protein [Methylobacterium sp. 10]